MRNEFFVERYAHERHEAHLSEAVLNREARAVAAPARQLRRRPMRLRPASVLIPIANLVVLARQQLASHAELTEKYASAVR